MLQKVRKKFKLQRKVSKLLVSVDYPVDEDDEYDEDYFDGNDSSTWL